jgi:uncharacterized membrane protein
MQQSTPGRISNVDGAIVGALAGVVGAVVSILIGVLVGLVFGGFQSPAEAFKILADNPEMPQEVRDLFAEGGGMGMLLVIGLVFGLIVYPLFGLVGGLFGAMIFAKKDPPPSSDQRFAPPPIPGGGGTL